MASGIDVHSLYRAAGPRNEKTQILKLMLRRTTALEQKWLVRVILKGPYSTPVWQIQAK